MRRALLLSVLLAAGCTSHGSAVLTDVPAAYTSKPAIIFVPGFYGSALKEKVTGRRVFLTGLEVYFGGETLSLFQSELGTPHGPDLEAEGVLGAVTVLPGLYEIDVYGPLIHRMRQLRPDAQIIPLAYDWRGDLSDAVARLDATVKGLIEKGCKSISIVSHSMGGLVATYYLAYGNQPPDEAQVNWFGAKIIHKAVFYGTPFNGSMIAFRSFDKGSGLPKGEKLMPGDAMSSYPSMYEMLPTTATLYDSADKKGQTHSMVDLFDPEVWKKNHFGLLRRTQLPAAFVEQRVRFTSEWLAKGKRFSDLVQIGRTTAWQPPADLKVLNIIGTGRETLDSGYLDGKSGQLIFDPKDVAAAGLKQEPLMANGDGTVTMRTSAVPAALEASTKVVMVGSAHDKLFLDPAADKEYKDFLELPPPPKP